MVDKKNDDDFIISFSDVLLICRESKKKIVAGTLLFGLLAFSYVLTRPIVYEAEATFREKAGKPSSPNPFSAAQLFLTGTPASNSETVSLMESRLLMEKLAEKRNLQASLSKKGSSPTMMQNIRDNLKIAYHNFRKRPSSPISEIILPLKVKQIVYYDEIPTSLNLYFTSEDSYDVLGPKNVKLGVGYLNMPFETKDFRFTIYRIKSDKLTSEHWHLSLSPLSTIAKNLKDQLDVEIDKTDTGLLKLKFKASNRHDASDLVNTFMTIIVDHIKRENKRISREQLDYLQVRQDEIGMDLKKKMENHADYVSREVSMSGFPDSSRAMDFLSHYQEQYQDRLFTLSLEEQRLQQANTKESPTLEKFLASTDNNIIKSKLDEIRNLKMNAISIDLALRNISASDSAHHNSFHNQMKELASIRTKAFDTKHLLANVESNEANSSLDNTDLVEQKWSQQLSEKQSEWENAPEKEKIAKEKDFQNCKTHFCSYLQNQIHMLYVQEKTLEERISHQRAPLAEFQALDLENAKVILFNYTKEMKDLEFKIAQNQFLIEELQQPDFVLTTLTTIINDSLSNGIAHNSSDLILTLMDDNYRSTKDKTRVQDELGIKKVFIEKHLQQGTKILLLQLDLIKDKINALQNIRLANLQQQISIFEKQLKDYSIILVENMDQERGIITNHQLALQTEIAKLPHRWVSEKLLDQQVEINKKMIQEVTSLVESKNISNNLDSLQSAPLDIALAPPPKSPKLLFMTVLGALAGAFIGLSLGFVQTLTKGIRATSQNLKLANQHVAGFISDIDDKKGSHAFLDQDLNTLRRLISYFDNNSQTKTCSNLLLIKGDGPDYSKHLATLLTKEGKKVLLLPLCFDQIDHNEQLPGLLQYLEGKAPEVKINISEEYHWISSGGITRFSNELLNSPNFKQLFNKISTQYDWIVAVSDAQISTADVESVMKKFDNIAINITNEKLQDLHLCIANIEESNSIKKLSFVMCNIC